MNALELAISLALMAILGTSTAQFVQQAWQSVGASARVTQYTRVQPALSTTFQKTLSEANRVNIYLTPAIAQQTSVANDAPRRTGGSTTALRLEYAGGPASGGASSWLASIYMSGSDLVYRNQNGNTWTIARNVTSVNFDLSTDGLLITTLVAGGLTYTTWTAVN